MSNLVDPVLSVIARVIFAGSLDHHSHRRKRERKRERERGREREVERERGRERERKREREREKKRKRERGKDRERKEERERDRQKRATKPAAFLEGRTITLIVLNNIKSAWGGCKKLAFWTAAQSCFACLPYRTRERERDREREEERC
jgi:hypothetical protein